MPLDVYIYMTGLIFRKPIEKLGVKVVLICASETV